MNTHELQEFLRSLWLQGVELWLEGDQLRFRGSKSVMDSKTLGQLKTHKAAVIALIQQSPDAYLGFPLSKGQQGIQLMQAMQPDSAAYNQVCCLALNDTVQLEVLEKSFDFLLQRHAPLRMAIKQLDGISAQQVNYSLPSILVTETRTASGYSDVDTWIDHHAAQAFKLDEEPLIRARLLMDEDTSSYHLLIVAHHIVADFWTMDLIIRELQTIYQATCLQQQPELPEIGKLYKDYVMAEQQWLESEAGQTAKDYWHDKLSPLPEPLSLPTDLPRPPQPSFAGVEQPFELSEAVTSTLKQQAKAHQVTPFVWTLSVFQTLLHLYTGQSRISVGTPVAGRTHNDYQKLAGHFTNPVVLLQELAGSTCFADLLSANKQAVLEAMKHQQYPLQQLIDELKPQGDTSTSPLFQVAMSWNQLGDTAPAEGDLIQSVERLEQRGAIYDLVLTGFDEGERIRLSLRYNTDIYSLASIERFIEHWQGLLDQTLTDPQSPIHQIDILTATEKTLIGDDESPPTYDRELSLAEHFARIVEAHPTTVAYQGNGTSLSYQALDQKANQLAHYLKDQGVKPNDRIALLLCRGTDSLSAILAVLKLGAIYVPVDPGYPEGRIQQMLKLAECRLILTTETLHDNELPAPVLHLGSITESLNQYPATAPAIEAMPKGDATASILFTSGSTGEPKGVEIPHRAIARLAINNGFLALKPPERIGYAANVAFDATNIEVWNALLNGATLEDIPADVLLDANALHDLIASRKLNALFLTTALFHLHVGTKPDMFANLDTLMTGGEAIDPALVARCFNHGRPKHLFNLYGPTENGTVSTACEIDESMLASGEIPIGKAIRHSQAYVLNPYGKPTPIGVIGEIYVAGDGLANGYLHRSDLTAKAFTARANYPQVAQYATGDLGYVRLDGQIMYAGRRDDQIKIRGFRIEVGEIEHRLSQHIQVNQACVIPTKDEAGQWLIAAYYSSDSDLSPNDVRDYLRQHLPDYMVPAAIMQMDILPINANGKIDKAALPEPQIERHHAFEPPRNAKETAIAEIWQTLLNLEQVGIHDHFFELGGHSLLAVNAAQQMQEALQQTVTMRVLFEHPTIADISRHLADGMSVKEDVPAITATQETNIPASLAQQRLWFVQQLAPESSAYNMPVALRIRRPVRSHLIEAALKTLIQRHQALHTRFQDQDGVAHLDVVDINNWSLPLLDLSRLNSAQAEQEAKNQLHLMANQAFDLAQDIPLRAIMISLNSQDHILALCLHHIAADGSAVAVLLDELGQLWQNMEAGKIDPLPQVALNYSDFSAWQRNWLTGERLNEQLGFWQQTLAGASPMLDLPTDKPRPPQLSNHGKSLTFNLPESLVSGLKTLSQDQGATLFMTLISAYSLLLARYSQQSDVCVGFPIQGNNQPALANMVGLFVNNLVLRSDVSDNPSVTRLIDRVKQSTIDAYAHQDAPFDTIVDSLGIERSLSFTPYLQASFALEAAPLDQRIQQALGDGIQQEPMAWHMAKYDLNLTCFESGKGMQATFEYSTDLFEAATIERMARHWCNLLESMVQHPDWPVNRLMMVSEEEQRALIANHNNVNSPLPSNVIQQFEYNAEQFSDHIALSFEHHNYSYAELNRHANRIAHQLIEKGISAGDFVGIGLPRSLALVPAILGILKAGAAYIPLDPGMPDERRQFIIEDAGVALVLVDGPSELECQTLDLSLLAEEIAPAQAENPNIHLPLDSTAYVIYTSGTTGKPKGCLVSHHNLARLFTSTENHFTFNEHQVWSLFHSYAFDFSVWEIWGALLYGGRVAVVPQWVTRSTDAFYRFVSEEQVTILNQTPSAFSQFIAEDKQQSLPLALNTVIFGGEALDFAALGEWSQQHSLEDVRLVNMYGITETTVHVTHHTITDKDIGRGRSVIGQPLDDLTVHLLDSHGQLVPIGVMGEMYISGPGVSQGYLKRPDLTASRFIDNPFAEELPAEQAIHHPRLYRSGDLARRLANGDIEYLGRIDHQVKIRGYRIELGEIEAVLSALDEVKDSVVLAREDEPGNKRLIAYLLASENHNLTPQILRHELKHALPDYMIPAAFVFMQTWPLTHNGKIDSLRLPKPATDDFLSNAFVAPQNDTEATIATIWQDVLGVERVGIHDNFFELGGHSLLATQVASRIRSELNCSLELKAIFESPTVAELALLILEQEIAEQALDDDDLLALLQDIEDEES